MSNCDHSSTITNPEWEEVCVLCGQVLSTVPLTRVLEIDEIHHGEIQKSLEDIISNAHIFPAIIPTTLFYYKYLIRDKKLSGFAKQEILCYALYSKLIENNAGRTLRELCYFFDIDTKKVWKIMKCMNDSGELQPEEFVSRFCEEMNIPFSYVVKINNILLQLETISSAKPQTLAAASIYIFCNEKEITVEKKILCQVSNITWPSIHSLFKKYKLTKYFLSVLMQCMIIRHICGFLVICIN